MQDVSRQDIAATSTADQAGAAPSRETKPSLPPTKSLAALLEYADVQDAIGEPSTGLAHAPVQDALVHSRLGVASALFAALRCKHHVSATHSLRVALGCSAWASVTDMPAAERLDLEIAGLLHDIGKIGVPEEVLAKTRRLSPDELAMMDRHRAMGLEILDSFCPSASLRDNVRYALAWFDGTRPGYERQGHALPRASRMLAIVDAFDAMTTDHVYRPAASRERAVAELFEFAGRQFDPDLVKHFSNLELVRQPGVQLRVAANWLRDLEGQTANLRWRRPESEEGGPSGDREVLFHNHLIDQSADGIAWVDRRKQIIRWNEAATRLTGFHADGLVHQRWEPSLLGLAVEGGRRVTDKDCPVGKVLETRSRIRQRWVITTRRKTPVRVDVDILPVAGADGTLYGAAIVMRDASQEVSLEKRIANLNEQVTLDPLTQVANRAEFDRVHAEMTKTHLAEGTPYCLIICDIDHFKKINDSFGHQAGDEAIQSFCQILKGMTREGDLVARYGGEEFVVLCPGCDNAIAAQRAEEMRSQLASIPLPSLSNRKITASFGVTEIQPGDGPETMLRRADRALLMAKESGRNTVVQLGSGVSEGDFEKQSAGWRWWPFSRSTDAPLLEQTLSTSVPLAMALQKLRGFVADHGATLESQGDGELQIAVSNTPADARANIDVDLPLLLDVRISEENKPAASAVRFKDLTTTKSFFHVCVNTIRPRDRRKRDALTQATQLMASLRAYLMATKESQQGQSARWGELGPV